MIGSETNFYLNLHFLEYFDDEVSICPPSLSLPSNSKIVDTDRLHCSTFLTFLLWKLCLCSGFDAELVNLIWRWNKDDTINLVFWKLIPWPKSQTLINVSGKIFKSLPSFQEDDVQQQDILFWKILFRKTKDFLNLESFCRIMQFSVIHQVLMTDLGHGPGLIFLVIIAPYLSHVISQKYKIWL